MTAFIFVFQLCSRRAQRALAYPANMLIKSRQDHDDIQKTTSFRSTKTEIATPAFNMEPKKRPDRI
jgi:hypothetical protein